MRRHDGEFLPMTSQTILVGRADAFIKVAELQRKGNPVGTKLREALGRTMKEEVRNDFKQSDIKQIRIPKEFEHLFEPVKVSEPDRNYERISARLEAIQCEHQELQRLCKSLNTRLKSHTIAILALCLTSIIGSLASILRPFF
jgi:hypothetical protein